MSREVTRSPSKMWYIAHVFFWVVTGIICYIVWKDDNRQMAKKHLIVSLWMPAAVWIAISLVSLAIIPDVETDPHMWLLALGNRGASH